MWEELKLNLKKWHLIAHATLVVREQELARHTGGCPALLSKDPGITPNSRDAETNGRGTILEACNKIGYLGISL